MPHEKDTRYTARSNFGQPGRRIHGNLKCRVCHLEVVTLICLGILPNAEHRSDRFVYVCPTCYDISRRYC